MYNTITANKSGGCRNLVNYLDKEDSLSQKFIEYLDKENLLREREYFFNGEDNFIEKEQVVTGIDKNCKGLKRDESRFFSLTFNPSQREIHHMEKLANNQINILEKKGLRKFFYDTNENIKEALVKDMLKQYIVKAMDDYAKNFGREGVNSNKDLVWFGRVEKDRYWKYSSKEVQHNKRIDQKIKTALNASPTPERTLLIKSLEKQYILESQIRQGGKNIPVREMLPKSGNNWHIHVIVSRRDKTQTKSLSPLAKARSNSHHKINGQECKIGFNRDEFTQKLETSFDKNFNYQRFYRETYEGRKVLRSNPELYKVKEAEYNVKHGIVPGVERNAYRQMAMESNDRQNISPAVQLTSTLAHQSGLNYVSSSLKPYKQTITIGAKIASRTIKSRRAASIAHKTTQKIVAASNPITIVADIAKDATVSLVKGFARGI